MCVICVRWGGVSVYRCQCADTSPGQSSRRKLIPHPLDRLLRMLQHNPRHLTRLTRLALPPLVHFRRHNRTHQLHPPILVPIRRAQRAVRHALQVVGQFLADDGLVGDDEAGGAGVQTERVVGLFPEIAREGGFVTDSGVGGGIGL